MNKHLFTPSLFLLGLALPIAVSTTSLEAKPTPDSVTNSAHSAVKFSYSTEVARRSDFSETLHGVKVADPYRWMENIDSAETKAWLAGQKKKADSFFRTVPRLGALRNRLAALQNYQRYSPPFHEGDKWFYSANSGLQNQNVHYYTYDLNKPGKVIVDPNALSADGTVSISSIHLSPNGRYAAYGLQTSGSDWINWQIKDLNKGKVLSDKIEWSKFSGVTWSGDSRGFYYSRFPAPTPGADLKSVNSFHTLYYHRLGTLQSQDTIVFGTPGQRQSLISCGLSEDKHWLVVEVEIPTSDNTAIFVKDLRADEAPNQELNFKALPWQFKHKYSVVTVINNRLIAQTDAASPNSSLVSIDLTQPKAEWQEFVAPQKDSLDSAVYCGGKIFCAYLQDAHTVVDMYDLQGQKLASPEMPGLGTAMLAGGKSQDSQMYFVYSDFSTPASVYRYNLASGSVTPWHPAKFAFNPQSFTCKQVFVTSKDGTKVPMFLAYKKNLKINKDTPVLMYGYGGFNNSMPPYFSTRSLMWQEMGGIYAQVCIRGGGEYGEAWHKAGSVLQKQNCFDDFIAAAEWLIANNYTSTAKLAINGGSNGGLLVGACMTQRPDLFGCCVPEVGVMDMLRFSKFTIGHYWTADYGDVNKPDEFAALYKYSPYHNIKKGTHYPPTLITTGDHDDRVFPAHSFKFAAELEYAQGGPAPIILRVDSKAGHGGGKPVSKRLDSTAELLGFIAKALNVKY